MLLVEYQKYRISKGDASALRSEVKDFFDFAIDPILLVRKQKGLEKVPTSCNSVCQLLSYVLRGR